MSDTQFQLVLCRVGHFYPQFLNEENKWVPDFCPFCVREGLKKLKTSYPYNTINEE